MGLNHINTEDADLFRQQVEADPTTAIKRKRVEGEWVFAEGQPQFTATLAFKEGDVTAQSDFPTFLGGYGLAPDPIQYCLYGLAACYVGTFVSVAAAEGVALRSVRVVVENTLNLAKTVGLSAAPIVERVDVTLAVDADASIAKLEELDGIARGRCPGVYCLAHPIAVTTHLDIREHG